MPDFYIDGQSLGNQQRGQPRRAKIAVAFNMIQEKWPELGAAATRKGVEPIKIYSDSLLIVNQVKGVYEVTDSRLRQLCDTTRSLMKKLGSVKLEWVQREGNYAGQWLEERWKGGKLEVVKDGQPGEVVAKV